MQIIEKWVVRVSGTASLVALRAHWALPILIAVAALCAAPSLAADHPFDLTRYRGKVVVLDFWASWCGPCRQSFPWLNAMQRKYASEGLVIVGINVDPERADASRFLKEVPAHFPMFYDPQGALASRYELMGMPSSLIFDTRGQLVATHVGFRKALRDEREAQLRELLRVPTQARN